jgi:hypothetical protein
MTKKRKERRREEAETRLTEYNKLTLSQKIEQARSRRGKSLKEVNRLMHKIMAITEPVDI